MGEAFHQGGWGMYPTLIAGLVLVGCSVRYAQAPDAARALVVRRLSLLTFVVGCLGFTAGLIKTTTSAAELPPNEVLATLAMGFGESLNNVGMALGFLVVSLIATSIGAARRGTAA